MSDPSFAAQNLPHARSVGVHDVKVADLSDEAEENAGMRETRFFDDKTTQLGFLVLGGRLIGRLGDCRCRLDAIDPGLTVGS